MRNNDDIQVRYPSLLVFAIYGDVFIFCILTSLDAFKVLAWGFMWLSCMSQSSIVKVKPTQQSVLADSKGEGGWTHIFYCVLVHLRCQTRGQSANQKAEKSHKELALNRLWFKGGDLQWVFAPQKNVLHMWLSVIHHCNIKVLCYDIMLWYHEGDEASRVQLSMYTTAATDWPHALAKQQRCSLEA